MTTATLAASAISLRRRHNPRWHLVAGLEVMLIATASSLTGLFDGPGWWFLNVFIGAIVFVAAAGLRALGAPALLGTVGGGAAAALFVFVVFGGTGTLQGLLPTAATLTHFESLTTEAIAAARDEAAPSSAPELLFLVAVGATVLAIALDALAAYTPALCAVPVAIVLLVPTFILNDGAGLFALAYCAAAFLLLLRWAKRSLVPGSGAVGGAMRVTSVSVVLALFVAATAPAFEQVGRLSFGSTGLSLGSGVNSLVDIGKDLNRPISVPALSYTSTSDDPPYLRLTSLDQFAGSVWKHRQRPTTRIHEGAELPELRESADVAAENITTEIQLEDVATPWLPVPYAPAVVRGLEGTWAFDRDDGTVVGVDDTASGQSYSIVSSIAQPTEEQLRQAAGTLPRSAQLDLRLPANVPDAITQTAREVTSGAATHFDEALALQSYFRSGEFTYSLAAPAVDDRSNGMDVVAQFLRDKQGYCVHFASAMAIMARTLDIPSRIALGYLPGSPSGTENGKAVYSVTSEELHAWPELFFPGVGWVPFEPTVGRADAASFVSADAGSDDDEGPSEGSSAGAVAPQIPLAPSGAGSATTDAGGDPWAGILSAVGAVLAALVVLLLPAGVREWLRRRRLARLQSGEGDAWLAWREVCETARDLGWVADATETPRAFANRLSERWPERGESRDAVARRSLESLRAALERAAYSAGSTVPDPAAAEELAVVLAALFDGAGRLARLRAVLLPVSLLPDPGRAQAPRTLSA